MRHTRSAWGFRLAAVSIVLVLVAGLIALHAWGPLSTFVVSGNSMEPGIRDGDLVTVRAYGAYGPGDAVAYQHRDLGVVLHRIVREDVDGFILQGDNRDAPDAYSVPASAIRGRLVLLVPLAGGAAKTLALAAAFGTLGVTALVALAAGWRPRAGAARFAGRRGGVPFPRDTLLRGEYFAITSNGARIAAGLAAIAFLALVALGVIQFVGTTGLESRPQEYDHRGTFSYEATGAPGVYDAAQARTGDPVFRRLADRVDIAFAYEFGSAAPTDLHGTYRLDVRLAQANGWNRSLEVVPPTPFDGRSFVTSAVLDLGTVQDAIEAMERQTGVESRAYLLTLAPQVEVEGAVAGVALSERFTPEQSFLLDELVLQPQPPFGTNALSFERVQHGRVALVHAHEQRVSLGGLHVTLAQLRVASLAALGLAGPGLAGWLLVSFLVRRRDETTVIGAQYHDILVRAHLDRLPANPALVAVDSIEDLVRIAELKSLPVLDEREDGGGECYFVVSPDGATYYYRPRTEAHDQRPAARRSG